MSLTLNKLNEGWPGDPFSLVMSSRIAVNIFILWSMKPLGEVCV